MRPTLLDPLFALATTLDGVGAKTSGLLAKIIQADLALRPPRVGDLLFVLPHTLIDRSRRPKITDALEGDVVTLTVRISHHEPPPAGRKSMPYRVLAYDDSGEISLTFFHAHPSYLERQMPLGEEMLISGRIEWFNGRASMVHPDHIIPVSEAERMPRFEPVYPLTAGLSSKILRRILQQAIARVPDLPEWQDAAAMAKMQFPSFADSLRVLHNPQKPEDGQPQGPAWRRLAYDELLAGQLALAMTRARTRKAAGRPLTGDGHLVHAITEALPFALTPSQQRAISDIRADLARDTRMLRLLQGDVGSGKTVVALIAMAQAAEANGQAAIMAPTELLARQHYATIAPIAEKVGLKAVLLTGREKGKERKEALAGLASGEIAFAIGTHALFQEAVEFKDLVLTIIDEQHRFGVHQRLAFNAKGEAPDMLIMTATPIPRTLVLSLFGDMDVSQLTEKPAGRKPIKTVTMSMDRLGELVDRLRGAIAEGQKVYWICPLVEETETLDLMSAEDRHASLRKVFGDRVGLVHGKMAARDKDAAMQAFRSGETRLLVGTTVVEVGVDVPDATIIVIEHAERFGLAQLHQLRGRVGRGDAASSCVLLFRPPLGAIAKSRLSILRDTDDGFKIAEEDLKLRGEGDLLGIRQSGNPGFQVTRLEDHADLLAMARNDARYILATDPALAAERGQALRVLLYLFGKDDAVRLLKAG